MAETSSTDQHHQHHEVQASYKESLIQVIKKHPEIYDTSHSGYRDHSSVKAVWKGMSITFNRPVEVIKRDWRNLRDTYWRMLKKSKTKSTWRYFTMMNFIVPFIKSKSRSSTDIIEMVLPKEEEEEEKEVENGVEGNDLSVLQERDEYPSENIMQYMNQSTNDSCNSPMIMQRSCEVSMLYRDPASAHEDPDRLFLLSLLPTLKELDVRTKSSTKIKMMNLLHEANYPDSERST